MSGLTPDVSMYNGGAPQQSNMLQYFGQAAGIQNALAHNQILQAQLPGVQAQSQQDEMNARLLQGKLDANAIIANTPRLPDGRPDTNAMKSQAAATNANALPHIYDFANSQYGSLGDAGVDASGTKQLITPGALAARQEQPAAGTVPSEIPPDPLNQRGYYQDVQNAGTSAQKDIVPLKNVYDILKSNPNNQGTILGAWNQYLAQHNIDVAGSKDAATAIQLTKDHAAQLNTSNASRSDQDLMAKEMANMNPNDLGGSLQKMIPYLIGTRAMAADQYQYLHNKEPNGIAPSVIGNARSFLQPRSDARVYELRFLQQNEPEAFNARVKSLSATDRAALAHTDNELTVGKPLDNE